MVAFMPPGHGNSQRLPEFAPVSNTTGPVTPVTGEYRELPPFTPVTNQTGPVPNNRG